MPSFSFSVATQIRFGQGVAREAGAAVDGLLGALGAGDQASALVIVDPGIRGASWLQDILGSLESRGRCHHVFDEVRPNPRDEQIDEAAALIRDRGVGAIIAIGGGSTIDTAKGASLIASHGGHVRDYAGWARVPGPMRPVVAIPTTAGSGSEVTAWAVITDSASHAKLAIGDPKLAPSVALVDPGLTASLPAGMTAATGMDALTHSIEAYVSALANPVNDLLALESIRLVGANLVRAVANGEDEAAREAMALASTLGGIAINNADVAGVHCLSEGMGSLYDAPHGLLNAILLPYFMTFWQAGSAERFARIAEALGAERRPEQAVNQVVRLARELKFPTLSQIGVSLADAPRLAELAEANVSNPSNPVPMTATDYLGILEQALA